MVYNWTGLLDYFITILGANKSNFTMVHMLQIGYNPHEL